jgi:hypothetical protein
MKELTELPSVDDYPVRSGEIGVERDTRRSSLERGVFHRDPSLDRTVEGRR